MRIDREKKNEKRADPLQKCYYFIQLIRNVQIERYTNSLIHSKKKTTTKKPHANVFSQKTVKNLRGLGV